MVYDIQLVYSICFGSVNAIYRKFQKGSAIDRDDGWDSSSSGRRRLFSLLRAARTVLSVRREAVCKKMIFFYARGVFLIKSMPSVFLPQ